MSGMKHNCGIYAASNDPNLKRDLYIMGISLQHRGQESAGVCVYPGGSFLILKDIGLVDQVLPKLFYEADFKSETGFGHNRYSTQGKSTLQNAQPVRVGRIALGHNGTLVNTAELRQKYGEKYSLRTETDSELIACIFDSANGDLLEGAKRCFDECVGSYNLIVMNSDGDMVVIRDPWGYHPLHITQNGNSVFVASEDVAFFAIGLFKPSEEVMPGEAILFTNGGAQRHSIRTGERHQSCFFEPVYFMTYGSTYRGRTVKLIRDELGRVAARKERNQWGEIDVIGVMRDSGTAYAEGYHQESGIPITDAFNRNRFLGRVYISPEGKGNGPHDVLKMTRRDRAALKNVPIPSLVEGKRIKIPDDSYVRGNTTEPLTRELFEAGAGEVHWTLISPPIRYPCFTGMDHATRRELTAARCETREEAERVISERIKATSVRFLDIEDLKGPLNDRDDHCWSCLDGNYPFELPPDKLGQLKL